MYPPPVRASCGSPGPGIHRNVVRLARRPPDEQVSAQRCRAEKQDTAGTEAPHDRRDHLLEGGAPQWAAALHACAASRTELTIRMLYRGHGAPKVPSDQGLERTTGLEPATVTMASPLQTSMT